MRRDVIFETAMVATSKAVHRTWTVCYCHEQIMRYNNVRLKDSIVRKMLMLHGCIFRWAGTFGFRKLRPSMIETFE